MKLKMITGLMLSFCLLLPGFLAAQTPTQPTSDLEKARTTLVQSLKETMQGGLQAWEVQDIEKASFPYVVERESRRVFAEVKALHERNKSFLKQITTAPQIRMHIMNAMAEAGLPTNVDNAVVAAIVAKLQSNVANPSNYTDDNVTLAVVGWGSGDHEAIKGWAPSKPAKAAERLIQGVAELLN